MLDRSLWVTACLTHPRPLHALLGTRSYAFIRLLRTRSLPSSYKEAVYHSQPHKPHNNNYKRWLRDTEWKGLSHRALNRLTKGRDDNFAVLPTESNARRRLSSWKFVIRGQNWKPYQADLKANREKLTRLWLLMGRKRRLYVWYSMMLFGLQSRPGRALVPLDVAINSPRLRPPRQILQDCMKAVAEHFLQHEAEKRPIHIQALHQFTCDYARVNSSYIHNRPFQQKIIWLILEHCDEEQLRSLFRSLLTYNLPLSSHTLLQFAEKFLDLGEVRIGFEIIRSAVNVGADLSSFALQSTCVRLLRIRPDRDDWYEIQSKFVTALLDMNIQPNVQLWTCVILNAVEAGDYREAWHWYDTGIGDGLKPNRVTFLVLLKIAKYNFDKDVLHRVSQDAYRERILPNDLGLVFDLLHTRLIIDGPNTHMNTTRGRTSMGVFNAMVRTYAEYCDIKPLHDLGIKPELAVYWQQPDHELPAPTPTIVGIILLAYIRRFQGTKYLKSIYDRYHELVVSEHPIIAPIANTDHIGNAFVKGFGSSADTIHHCTEVVKHMLTSNPFGFSSSTVFPGTTKGQIGQATLQTWNILIDSYMKHGNTEAAEKVLSMLQIRGFKPDSFTWNHLIHGYIDGQAVEKVIGVTRAMREARMEYDERTIAYLQRLTNKPRFFKALNDMDRELNDADKESNGLGTKMNDDEDESQAYSETTADRVREPEATLKNASSSRASFRRRRRKFSMDRRARKFNIALRNRSKPSVYSDDTGHSKSNAETASPRIGISRVFIRRPRRSLSLNVRKHTKKGALCNLFRRRTITGLSNSTTFRLNKEKYWAGPTDENTGSRAKVLSVGAGRRPHSSHRSTAGQVA